MTLTFAQSSDGKISGPEKKMLALSGEQSGLMTHQYVCMRIFLAYPVVYVHGTRGSLWGSAHF